MTDTNEQFRASLEARLRASLEAPAGHRFADYFGPEGVQYAGAAFETYRPSAANSIEPSDLIALTFLSIGFSLKTKSGVTPHATLRLEERRDDVTALLEKLPSDTALEDLDGPKFDKFLGDGSPGERLYDLLRKEVGLPRVATYKLLARKRPALIPIRDTVLERALGHERVDEWWRPWWSAIRSDSGILGLIDEINATGPSDTRELSRLRTADIAIWMLHH